MCLWFCACVCQASVHMSVLCAHICICMLVEARGSTVSCFFWDKASHWLSIHRLNQTGWPMSPRSPLRLSQPPLRSQAWRGKLSIQILVAELSQAPVTSRQAQNQLSYLPSPSLISYSQHWIHLLYTTTHQGLQACAHSSHSGLAQNSLYLFMHASFANDWLQKKK